MHLHRLFYQELVPLCLQSQGRRWSAWTDLPVQVVLLTAQVDLQLPNLNLHGDSLLDTIFNYIFILDLQENIYT